MDISSNDPRDTQQMLPLTLYFIERIFVLLSTGRVLFCDINHLEKYKTLPKISMYSIGEFIRTLGSHAVLWRLLKSTSFLNQRQIIYMSIRSDLLKTTYLSHPAFLGFSCSRLSYQVTTSLLIYLYCRFELAVDTDPVDIQS